MLELSTWDLLFHNQLMLFLILVLNISQSLVFFAMIVPLEAFLSRNMIQFVEDSLKELNLKRDAEQWHMTCTNHNLRKFFLGLHQKSHMALQNSKDSSGKTIHASNLSQIKTNGKNKVQLNLKCNSNKAIVLTSNSWLYTRLLVLDTIMTVFLVYLLIRMRERKNYIIFMLSRSKILLIEPWLVLV